MNCKNCNTQIMEGEKFCPNCGTQTEQEERAIYCPNCGTPIYDGEKFCTKCGRRSDAPTIDVPTDRPTVAGSQKSGGAGLVIGIIATIVAIIAAIVTVIMVFWNGSKTSDSTNVIDEIVSNESDKSYAPPVFDYLVGSSTRDYDIDTSINQRCYYYEEYAMDNDMRTAWTPDRNIDASPSLTLYASAPQHVNGIRMTNGYCKSEKTYTKNRRISKVKIVHAEGEQIATFGMDHYCEMIDVPFNNPVDTDFITIYILDSYYGEWKDIAISEIAVY